ncbi:hypothetical protein LCGC14_2325600 [marine sediment metagenome]|uniref:Uncharacterized protein n=1 Tax=marine sediment metagenome TaxID=412755 RepID=A0A0F9D422_9ZZZZ
MGVVLVRTFILLGMGINLLVGVVILGLTDHEWFAPLFALVVFELGLFVVALIGFLQVTYDIVHPKKEKVSYTTMHQTEDWMASNVKARASLEVLRQVNPRVVLQIVLDVLEEVDFDLARQTEIANRIRTGTWHKDQPGTDSTRGNGDSR